MPLHVAKVVASRIMYVTLSVVNSYKFRMMVLLKIVAYSTTVDRKIFALFLFE